MRQHLILIFIGGGLGSATRYLLSRWIQNLTVSPFPWGTLTVNIFACFLFGLFIGFADQRGWMATSYRYFWVVGFCGGFSTFSAFSGDMLALTEKSLLAQSVLYALVSVGTCLAAVVAGLFLSERI
ncbi:MAG TPA: fluoride efflux transporter CrcB [Cytophagales bacterium]|nr:fluoride efflux transporter CrcB [Cytophagales bacterium]